MTTPRASAAAKKTAAPRKTATPRVVITPEPVEDQTSQVFLIHFVSDGLSFLGYNWRPGQELEIRKPSSEYDRTCDAKGISWLNMSDEEQVNRWGEVKFRHGPSSIPNSVINYREMPSDGFDSYGRPKYTGHLSKGDLARAAQAEKDRGRKTPAV